MREAVSCLQFGAEGRLLSGDRDGEIRLWDAKALTGLATYHVKSKVLFLGFLPEDRSFVAVDESRHVTVVDPAHGGVTATFELSAKPLMAALDSGRRILAVALKNGTLSLFDLKAGLPAGEIDARNKLDTLLFLRFDRLGQQLLAIDKTGKVMSWNPATLRPLRELALAGGSLHGSRSEVRSAATNRAANIFAVGLEEFALARGNAGLVYEEYAIAYDWSSGQEVKRVKTQESLDLMAMGPGNDHIATVAEKGRAITLIDLRKGEMSTSVQAPAPPTALAISEDNQWMAAGLKDGQVLVWSLGYRDDGQASSLQPPPSLAGRIRTTTGTEPALKPGVPTRLAILAFEAKGVDPSIADICLDSLSNGLANRPYITLVERKQIQAVLAEQKIQASGLTDEGTSVRLGRLLNADHVLTCSIGRLGTTLVLTARLIEVETGKVVQGREVVCEECRDQDIFDAVKMLAATLAR